MSQQKVKALILDMDGVLWRGDEPIGDLARIFERIEKMGLGVAFVTNNGTRTAGQYIDRLASFGIEAKQDQIFTSAHGVAELVSSHFSSQNLDRPIPLFVIGEQGIRDALEANGFRILEIDAASDAKAVIVGIDRSISFQKMAEATLLVRRGIPFFATNPDRTFPTPRGEIPGAGAWISVIETASGVTPLYAGKPSIVLLEMARSYLGTSKADTLVIGDRLETDIAGGQKAGMPVALVLSGVSTMHEALDWKPKIELVAEDLDTLIKNLG